MVFLAEVWWAPRPIYRGAEKSLAQISYIYQDLKMYTKAYSLMILLFLRHKFCYIIVSTGRCSWVSFRVGIRTYLEASVV